MNYKEMSKEELYSDMVVRLKAFQALVDRKLNIMDAVSMCLTEYGAYTEIMLDFCYRLYLDHYVDGFG